MNSINNEKNNFGFLRLLAAYFVLISHSFGLLGMPFEQPLLHYGGKNIILSDIGLEIFFTISGYLVTHSLVRSQSLKHYFFKRAVRIFPALVVANIACIILGCFLTRLSFKEYIVNKQTLSFFLKNTVLVFNQFELPGVFWQLNEQTVNASLWTLFVEVEFYIVPALFAIKLVKHKWLYLSFFVIFQCIRVYVNILHPIQIRGIDFYPIFVFGTYFYLGSLMYCFKNDLSSNWLNVILLLTIVLLTGGTIINEIALSVFLAYCTLLIGTARPILHLNGYDPSYGIYLYAFPIQQSVILWCGYGVNVWIHISVSAALATTFGLLSWLFIEMPFLSLKTKMNLLSN